MEKPAVNLDGPSFTLRQGYLKIQSAGAPKSKQSKVILQSDGTIICSFKKNMIAKKLLIHITMNSRCDWGPKFLDNVDGKRFAILGSGPKGSDETFIFESETEQETTLWVNDICQIIASKRALPKSLSSPVLRLEPGSLSDDSGTNSKTSQSSDTAPRLPTQNEYRDNMDQLFETFVKRGRNPEKEFQIMRKLGEGGFGSVHLARRLQDQQLVALKIMKRTTHTDYQLIMEEVTALGLSSAHENIVNCLDCFITDNEVWLVMEYMYGGSLHSLLHGQGALTEEHVAYVSKCLLSAISFLHKSHRLHRDLKSDNIILGMEGEVKLTDFGFSAQLTQERQHRLSKCGTTAWMAPEVLLSQEYSYKADIWSFGILVLEMAEGMAPGLEMSESRLELRIITNQPPQLKDKTKWSPEFHDFLSKILVRDPKARWQAHELLEHAFLERAGTKASFAKVITFSRMSRTTTVNAADEDADWEFFTGYGLVVVDYDPEPSDVDHLKLRVGDKIIISGKQGKFYKGIRNGKETGAGKGIIPTRCVALNTRNRNAQVPAPEDSTTPPTTGLKKAASARLLEMTEDDQQDGSVPIFGKTQSLAGSFKDAASRFAPMSSPTKVANQVASPSKSPLKTVSNSSLPSEAVSPVDVPPVEGKKKRLSTATPPPPEDVNQNSRDFSPTPPRDRRKSSASSAMAFFMTDDNKPQLAAPDSRSELDSDLPLNLTCEIHTPQPPQPSLPTVFEPQSPESENLPETSPILKDTSTAKAFLFDNDSEGEAEGEDQQQQEPDFFASKNVRHTSEFSNVSVGNLDETEEVRNEPSPLAQQVPPQKSLSDEAKAAPSTRRKQSSTHVSDSEEDLASPRGGLSSVVIREEEEEEDDDDDTFGDEAAKTKALKRYSIEKLTKRFPRSSISTREALRKTAPAKVAPVQNKRKSTSAIPSTSPPPGLARQGSDLTRSGTRVAALASVSERTRSAGPTPTTTTTPTAADILERRRSLSRPGLGGGGPPANDTPRGRQAVPSVALRSIGNSKEPSRTPAQLNRTKTPAAAASQAQTPRTPRTPRGSSALTPRLALGEITRPTVKRTGSILSPTARRSTGNTPPSPRQFSRLRSLNSMTNLTLNSAPSEAEEKAPTAPQTDRPRFTRSATPRATTASPRRSTPRSPTPVQVRSVTRTMTTQSPAPAASNTSSSSNAAPGTQRSGSRGILTRTATPPRMPKTKTMPLGSASRLLTSPLDEASPPG